VSPRHAALALATGLVCGVLSSRIGGMISPPYAAILGTLVVYPVARRGVAAVAATGETQPITPLPVPNVVPSAIAWGAVSVPEALGT
jgi:hypothetical protein